MDFRILGPLEVLDEGHPLDLGGPKQRALLTLLLLRRPGVVSSERLIDELWAGRPPATAAKSIQVYVSRLRKVLGEGVLITRERGYGLQLEPDQVDLDRFEHLLEEGRSLVRAGTPERGAERLAQALACWRGPALADLAYEPFAEIEIARLEELRLTATEEWIDAALLSGRHAELVAELQGLVRAHPLRERLRGQLMLALYRAGRQADALAAYQDARRILVEQLGLQPSPSLQELERAILSQDAVLDAPQAPDTEHPLDGGGAFVGRDRELRELLSGLDDALRGRGRLFLVSGEPGIGKSRLAEELANRARRRGAEVLTGRCWEAGGAPAYWPWVQAIRACIRTRDPRTIRELLGQGAPEIAEIVPELRDVFPDVPRPPSGDSEGARFRLFEAVASFFRRAAGAQPIVLVLDDLHAADAPSLLLLEFLGGELASAELLVVAAYRDVDPTLADPLSSSLAELTRHATTRTLALSGLSEHDVASVIELIAGFGAEQAVVSAVHRETEGNPLFISELVRLLAADGRLAQSQDEVLSLSIPHGIQTVIDRRLRRLPAECRRVLALASVFGREFRVETLELLSERSGDEILDAIDPAVADRILRETPESRARFRFSHALVRDVLYYGLPAGRRVRLHRRAGEALERVYARDTEPHIAEIAHHFLAAAPGGGARQALNYASRAAKRASGLLAFEEAVRLFRGALGLLETTEGVDREERCELLLELGDAQARSGDEGGAKDTFLRAAAAARTLQAPELFARAALGYGGRFLWARAGSDEHLVPLLEEALEALSGEDAPLRVKLMARLAGALRDQHEREPRDALGREAVAMARRLGDVETLSYALDGWCWAIFWPENPEQRMEILTELLSITERGSDPERALQARYYRGVGIPLELGDLATARREFELVAPMMEALRQPAHLWFVVVTRANLALLEGRFDAAQELIERALALGERAQGSDAVLSHGLQLFTLRWEQGPLDDLEEMLLHRAAEYPARPMFRCLLALLYTELDRLADARDMLDALAADGFAALPLTNEWLFSMGFLAEVAVRLRNLEHCAAAYQQLLPYATRNACTPDEISTGSVSRPLGLLASAQGSWSDAEHHFQHALEQNEQMGARPWVAHTQRDYATMLLARGGHGDQERAAVLTAAARETFLTLGMDRWASETSVVPTAR